VGASAKDEDMELRTVVAGLAAVAFIATAAPVDAGEVRLATAELDRVVAGEDQTIGESFSFAGSANVVLRTLRVSTPLPFTGIDPTGLDAPMAITPTPIGPVGFGRRDLLAAFQLALGR